MKQKLMISACLLGENCKYSGGNNYTPLAEALGERYELLPVCPERLGGLPTPRAPAERVGERVLTRDGADVTQAYLRGAEAALAAARANGITAAVFQQRSPSCGSGRIYDGTFTGRLVSGQGVAAELLTQNGIKIYCDSQLEELLREEKES